MISVSNLSRSYGSTLAVSDVSFEITSGEVVGLLGHNGAGKTTIMKMITGFIEPSSGSVEVDGLALGENTVGIQKKSDIYRRIVLFGLKCE
ncbi:MAG: hypothetical protein CM15mP58_01830 [Burkholderiaceae bacterium]|nr:MAG: hypothetical protein CM15mP58_01830 [Burkholderiaceae bacterium]